MTRELILTLPSKCPLQKCTFQIDIFANILRHIPHCAFRTVACKYSGCSYTGPQGLMRIHEDTCDAKTNVYIILI